MQIPNLYHYSDPNAKNYHPWHFVYAHGEAEIYNGQQMQHLEDRDADDLICSDQPMPTQEGEYKAKLYGKSDSTKADTIKAGLIGEIHPIPIFTSQLAPIIPKMKNQ